MDLRFAIRHFLVREGKNDEVLMQIATVVFAGGGFRVQIKAERRYVKIDIFGSSVRLD